MVQAEAGPMRPPGAQQTARTQQGTQPRWLSSYPADSVELATFNQDLSAGLNARLAGWKDESGTPRKPKIVVLDFCTWENEWIPFGAWLADRVSAGITSDGAAFEVMERLQAAAPVESRQPGVQEAICSSKAVDLARSAGADFYVTARFVAVDNDLGVTLNAQRVLAAKFERSAYFVKSRVAISGEMARHLGESLDSLAPTRDAYNPGVNGVSIPKCVYCPSPPFTPETRNKKISGEVVMIALITGDGHVSDLKLKKSLEPSLDRQAMETVGTWRFEPARDADGVPVSVHFPIEVSFRSN